jgi:hypothetical protein
VTLDENASLDNPAPSEPIAVATVDPRDAVGVLLDGVEARARQSS